jgi:hypothetical protein
MSQYPKYCRLGAKFAAIAMELPPPAIDKDIPVMAMRVPRSDPYRMGARRLFPPARLPAVGIAIPAVVSAHPDMLPAWTSGTMFPDANRGGCTPELWGEVRRPELTALPGVPRNPRIDH